YRSYYGTCTDRYFWFTRTDHWSAWPFCFTAPSQINFCNVCCMFDSCRSRLFIRRYNIWTDESSPFFQRNLSGCGSRLQYEQQCRDFACNNEKYTGKSRCFQRNEQLYSSARCDNKHGWNSHLPGNRCCVYRPILRNDINILTAS